MFDLKDDLIIDSDSLDEELLNQPLLLQTYGEAVVESKFKMEKAKDRIEYIEASLDLEIRKDPESFGLKKLTESAITSTIKMQPEHQKALESYLKAKKTYEMNKVALLSIEQRKDMLEALVKLYLSAYYAETIGDNRMLVDMQQKEIKRKRNNQKVKESLNNKENSERRKK